MDFPEFYKLSFTSDQWEKKRATAEQVNAYLDEQEDLSTEVNWSVIKAMSYTEHNYVSWAVENAGQLKEKYPDTEVDKFVQKYIYAKVGNLKGEESLSEMESRIHKMVDSLLHDNKKEMKDKLFTKLYYQRKEYAKLLDHAYQTDGEDRRSQLINAACWGIYTKSEDPELIKRAISAMHKTVEKDPNLHYIDTMAHLYYKSGDIKQARKYATEALMKGKEKGIPTEETEKLLKKLDR